MAIFSAAVLLASTAVLHPGHALAKPTAPPAAGRTVAVVPGATKKICQVVGETDRETGAPTRSRTASTYGFWGTDLGASFEHQGKLYFLFGDTHSSGGLARPRDGDLIAVAEGAAPGECPDLRFIAEADGQYRALTIPGVDLGPFAVPTGGFSANGAMYVFATTDHSAANPMGRSVLARSRDDGRTFEHRYDVSTERFINIAPAVVDAAAQRGLPTKGRSVLLWASGRYRQSNPHLAVIAADAADTRDTMRYFAGLDAAGAPRWSAREDESAPLFHQPCLGELSVAWLAPLRKWAMTYNCEQPSNRILLRTADEPWGPWSEPVTLFDPVRDGGFCRFMHAGPKAPPGCKPVTDPHTPSTVGAAYGPYLIAPFTRGTEGESADIYFLMSTWNPYTVVLMEARLRLEPAPGAEGPLLLTRARASAGPGQDAPAAVP